MKVFLFFYYIFALTALANLAWADNNSKVKPLNDNQYMLTLSRQAPESNFNEAKLDAACLINTKDGITTEHCRLDFLDNKNVRFLSHKFKYRKHNKTVEFSVKDSRNITAYRQSFSNKDNWIPKSFLDAYLKFISDINVKEQNVLIIDENGLTEVKKLDS